jgi:MOSC domain-containing protein YiiM
MYAHVLAEELEAGLPEILESPRDEGTVELVVRRPAEGQREILGEGLLDVDGGLVGDRWHTSGGRGDPRTQLTLMNARVIAMIAGQPERWALAGDQLYVDLDLTPENLPPGAQLEVGTAVIEVTDVPHTGCAKFTERFGSAATRFVNAAPGRGLRMRGMNARVVTPGSVRPGDTIRKLR